MAYKVLPERIIIIELEQKSGLISKKRMFSSQALNGYAGTGEALMRLLVDGEQTLSNQGVKQD